MRNKLFFLLLISISQAGFAQTDLDNRPIDLKSFEGKKILYIVLPGKPDSSLLNQMERFQSSFGDKIKMIALVTPNGDRLEAKNALAKIADSGIMVSEGIKQRRADSPERESVMEWITEKRMQSKEDDEKETWCKYFISEDGRLFATLGPDMSLDDPLIPAIVNAVIPRSTYQQDPSVSPEKSGEADQPESTIP